MTLNGENRYNAAVNHKRRKVRPLSDMLTSCHRRYKNEFMYNSGFKNNIEEHTRNLRLCLAISIHIIGCIQAFYTGLKSLFYMVKTEIRCFSTANNVYLSLLGFISIL